MPGPVMTLIILPGMDGSGLLLQPFISALGPNFSVKIVRYPVTGPLGYAELERLASAALPEDGLFFILGESFSGPIAAAIASAFPARVQGLILCCSFVKNPRPALAWLKPVIPLVPVARAPQAVLSHLLLGGASSGAMRSALAQALAHVSAPALRARLRAVLEVDVSEKLAALDTPILYLRAAHDRVVPRGAADKIARLNPRVRIVQIDAPHFLLQAAPADAARAVADFALGAQNAGIVLSSGAR